MGIELKTLPDDSQSPDTPSNTPKTPLETQKTPPGTPNTPHDPQEQLWLLQNTRQTFWEAFGLSRDVREDSGGNESVRSCLLHVRDACKCLGLLWQCLRICQGWFRSVWGYLRVSLGVGRCKRGSRGVSGSIFLSISFNFRKLQIISLTFSNRPRGLRCLKYQNVPKLRSFWPIGKPREMFQIWDIRVYFIAVPKNDKTVFARFYRQ